MQRLRELPVTVVHAATSAASTAERLVEICDAFLARTKLAGQAQIRRPGPR